MRVEENGLVRAGGMLRGINLFVASWSLCTGAVGIGAQLGGKLAYLSGTGQENQAVHVMDLASWATIKVGPGSRDGAPRWSPDGAWLAFETRSDKQAGIYLVRADGTDGRVVSKGHPSARMPRWSPDGKRLAYEAAIEATERPVIVVLEIASGVETVWGGEKNLLMRPVWLPGPGLISILQAGPGIKGEGPDADLLSQELKRGALLAIGWTGTPTKRSTEIFMVSKTQAAAVPALANDSSSRAAEWEAEPDPQGTAVAFESNDGSNREIFILSKTGKSNLTKHLAADWNPVWSPDGKSIAFESFRDGRRGVYRCSTGTEAIIPVDASALHDCWAPTWSPTGEYIAYGTTETGDPGLKVAAVTTGTKEMLSTGHAPAWAPAWAPEPASRKVDASP